MIQLSQTAIKEILRLRAKTAQDTSKLRISTLPSGCLTYAYKLAFDTDMQVNDQTYLYGDIQLVVSAEQLPYLENLVIDYAEDLMGGSFRFHNPKAVRVCGCGSSFAIIEE